ncbi:type II toxin-antitoxin system VapB family antitoxin [Luteococcus sp. OSA5]|uniref:type II toxin-antitoxin system VapB family antitoxin n=1 Tax=Luteococcus sp. OSA5 TaxID=3401630 RepID=UPI003B42F186
MAINIKNEQVLELVREASRLTGYSQTGAIETALRELIAHRNAVPRSTRLDLVWRTLDLVDGSVDDAQRLRMQRTMDEMYDESGLPA